MLSKFFATRAISLSCNSNSSGKQSTLVKKEIEFLHANLCEVRVDSDYGYGFLDGTEERKEDLIEQFTTLNSTCFVRSTTEVKERSRRSSENGIFILSILGLQFSGKGKRLRKTEDEYSQGRPCQGFHVYITKQLDLSLPFVC